MKLIIAVVKPFKVSELADAFENAEGFPGMTVLDARGLGRGGHGGQSAVDESLEGLSPHRVVLIGATDRAAEVLARQIREIAHTGLRGDGKVFVLDMGMAIAIASGQEGEATLE
jgi:nitrogen regulatory protein PII